MSRNLGSMAENLAAQYFSKIGYKILARNFRAGHGEIDLILEKDSTIVFVEVKARKSLYFGLPQESVTAAKQATIRRVSEAFLQKKNMLGREVRFDVLAVTFADGSGPEFEHIPFAF